MNIKKILFTFLILMILSITAVSAADSDNINATDSIEPEQVIESVNTVEHKNTLEPISKNKQIYLSNIKATSTSPGTFDDLQLEINNAEDGSVLVLTRDYNGQYGSRIHLDKDLTIDGQGHTLDCQGQGGCSAFYSTTGNIALKNIRIVNGHNDYNDRGGAIHIEGSAKYTLENCEFENNWANKFGGAIYNNGDALTIKNCRFTSNKAEDNSGGAIYSNGQANIENSIFEKNNAYEDGGAIYCKYQLEVKNCLFDSNQAKGSKIDQCHGGAIRAGNVIVDSSRFIYNCAEDYGGAIYTESITFNSNPSYFIGNTAEDNVGGAIYTNKITNGVVSNVFFIKNQAKANDDGGAIYILNANYLTFDHCVFVDNYCGDEGGAIYLGAEYSYLSLSNNIFKNNRAGDEGHAVYTKGMYSAIYNNWWGDWIPLNNNGVLVKWDIFNYNIHYVDSDPLHVELRLSKNSANVNYMVRANLYYVKSDGSILLNGPIGNVSFNLPENIMIKSAGKNQNGTWIEFTSNKIGLFDITANLYGQSITQKINFTQVLKEDEGFYSNLRNEIGAGGDIVLTKKCYHYIDGDGKTIEITTPGVIDGKGAVIDMAGANMQALKVKVSGVTIKNLTIKNVNCANNGGAIYFSSSGNVSNCNFTNNSGTYGGAVYFRSTGSVSNCNFINNTAGVSGGAVYFYSKGNVLNCNFINNTAGLSGGAIYFINLGNVTNCNFINNAATTSGGSVWFSNKGTVSNCIFSGNIAQDKGGAIFSWRYNTVTVDTCIFKTSSDTTYQVIFRTSLIDPELNISISDVTEGSNATIIINTNNTFNGNVTVIIGNKNYTVAIVNGEGSCNVSGLKTGNYTATVILNQTETFQATNKTINFTVKSKENQTLVDPELNISISDVTEGTNATITINTNNTYNGNATVTIGDKNYTVAIVNGEGSCNVSGLKTGNYTATVILNQTETFQATNKTINFTVKSKENQTLVDPELNISISDVTEGTNATITINTNNTYNGNATVTIGDKNYTVAIVNGEGSCNVSGLKADTYTAMVMFNQTENFNASNKTISFTVKNKPISTIIKSSEVTTTYATSKNIIITLTTTQGKALSGKKVSVVLNGVSKILTTNAKGQITLATGKTLTPKTYKVSFKFTGDTNYIASSGSVNLIVKKSTPKITAKNKNYKAKTKNKKYTITLKNDKNQVIKNTKLTLKVNGKTYTAKTNNKGQATFQITKLAKKGKYKTTITFKTNQYYNKITTKTTITIK